MKLILVNLVTCPLLEIRVNQMRLVYFLDLDLYDAGPTGLKRIGRD